MKVSGIPTPYDNPHNKKLKPSINIRCNKTEARRLHDHYDMCLKFMDTYWNTYWECGRYSDYDTHMNSNLKYKPIRKNTFLKSVGYRRFQHMPEDYSALGKFYNHYQIRGMLENKVNHRVSRNTLQDWTESMYHRWNYYVKWIKQWDETYNKGAFANDGTIDELKVEWLRLKPNKITEDPSLVH